MFKWFMLLIYILLCAYVISHVFRWSYKLQLRYRRVLSWGLLCVMAVMASSIFFGKFLPESHVQYMILKISNYWIGFLIYMIFFLILADFFLLVLNLIEKKWNHISYYSQMRRGYYVIGVTVIILSIGFTTYGGIHAKEIQTAEYDITVDKSADGVDQLNVALIADLHLGYSVGCPEMKRMVKRINDLQPDIVILAGDIFDNDYDALDDPAQLEQILKGIQSKYGVYAVYGNHDVAETLIAGFSIGSAKKAMRDSRMDIFLENSNIHILEDETVLVDQKFYLTGRLDGEKTGYGALKRTSLETLSKDWKDQSKPVLVINHEPDHLSEYADAGVDVLLSGHTHAGQFFPLTITCPLTWENYWGIKQVGHMYSLVTSGVGVYGPDMRVGTDSEVMYVRVHFTKE